MKSKQTHLVSCFEFLISQFEFIQQSSLTLKAYANGALDTIDESLLIIYSPLNLMDPWRLIGLVTYDNLFDIYSY